SVGGSPSPNADAAAGAEANAQAAATKAASKPPAQAAKPENGKQLDMDWDDEDEATHVFDKESRDAANAGPPSAPRGAAAPAREERASMDDIMTKPQRTTSAPPAPAAAVTGPHAQNGSSPSGSLRAGSTLPPGQLPRSAPPPPP